jgi:type I restriction enzyme S subunit
MADKNGYMELASNSAVPFKYVWELTHWDKRFNGVENRKQVEIRKYSYLLASDLKALAHPDGNIKLLNTGAGDFGFTTAELAGTHVANGEIIGVPWGGTPSVQYYSGPFVTADNRIAVSRDTEVMRTRFLYFSLMVQMPAIKKLYRGSGIKHPDMNKLLDLRVPVPPIDVQDEIVRILDIFTALETELEAELEARTKQFSYYLDCVYNLETAANPKSLANLGVFIRGNGLQKSDLQTEGEVPAFHYGQIHTFYRSWATITKSFVGNALKERLRHVQPGDIAIATTAEDNSAVGKAVAWLGDEDAVISGDAFVFRHKLDPLYATYFFQSSAFDIQKQKLITGTKVKRISGDALGKIHIPTPSLERQKIIGLALQKLDGLLSGSEASLPAERTLRKRQYEYYLDQLLTFKQA